MRRAGPISRPGRRRSIKVPKGTPSAPRNGKAPAPAPAMSRFPTAKKRPRKNSVPMPQTSTRPIDPIK